MPRLFDPERTDPTVKFINSLRELFNAQQQSIPIGQFRGVVEQFLRQDQYAQMLRSYAESNTKFPDLVFRNNCSAGYYFTNPSGYQQKYFKVTKGRTGTEDPALESALLLSLLPSTKCVPLTRDSAFFRR